MIGRNEDTKFTVTLGAWRLSDTQISTPLVSRKTIEYHHHHGLGLDGG
jgi:hypothetical protein